MSADITISDGRWTLEEIKKLDEAEERRSKNLPVNFMLTVTKRFSNNKAAHRNWQHPGHCAKVHGENWTFDITFKATKLNECGFVIDFGGLKYIKDWFAEVFDHVLLIEGDDPNIKEFQNLSRLGLTRLTIVTSATAEGLAEMVFKNVDFAVKKKEGGRVWVSKVVCFEDTNNSSTYEIG